MIKWLVVDLPLWKIWLRQLGWWLHSQLFLESHKIPWFQFQSPPTSQPQPGFKRSNSPGGLLDPWYPVVVLDVHPPVIVPWTFTELTQKTCAFPYEKRKQRLDLMISQFNFWIFISIHLICIWPDFFGPKSSSSKTPCLHLNKNQIIINKSSKIIKQSSNTLNRKSQKKNIEHPQKSSNIIQNHPNIEHPSAAASAAACLDPIDFISSMACGHGPPMAEP